MPDNVAYTEGSGRTIATDLISGVDHQRIKIEYGADGSATDVAVTAPLPIIPGHPSTKVLTTAVVDIAASGDNTIVAAVASQTTRIHVLVLIPDADVNIVLKRGTTALTGTLRFKANQPFALSFQAEPHFVTGTNEAFIVNLSGAISVDGWVQYETSA